MAALPPQIRNAYARLSIAPGTDAGAVQRAYAAALGQLDPERQAEAFDNLRAAYETAMTWTRQHESPGSQEGQRADQAASTPDAAAETAAEAATAVSIDTALAQWLPRLADRMQPHPDAILAQALQDERLASPAAQAALETRLAALIAQDPWRRASLFDAAVARFHWDTDNAGRLADRWTAAWILHACSESLLWRGQPEADRMRQVEAMRAALANPVPAGELLHRHFFAMEALMGRYAYWLNLRMPSDVLQAWARAYNDPGFTPPSLPKPLAPRARRMPALRMPSLRILLVLVLLAMAVLRLVFYPDSSPSAPYDKALPAPRPAPGALRDAIEHRQAALRDAVESRQPMLPSPAFDSAAT